MSAGEKQLYAVSLLWALARISGRPLPVVIDTPLARLDVSHRNRLLTEYFSNVSHQVVILSTDTEVDEEAAQLLSPATSHALYLRYDPLRRATSVEEGYFAFVQDEEVVLAG